MSEEDLYKAAEKRVEDKLGFYNHLYSFIIVNVILAVINILFYKDSWWFCWVTLFWGIGLLSHFIKIFILSGKLEGKHRDRMIEKEMEKMRK